MDIIFILVEPAVPENVGAAARSLKTMGFRHLRLVNPCNHLADEARWLAHGSNDVLESAKLFDSFSSSIGDIDFTIGTSAKKRSVKGDYYTPEEASLLVSEKSNTIQNIGLVFGREESGLTNEELKYCDIISQIPLKNPYPSINLAQSVMIFAYVFKTLKSIISVSDKSVSLNSKAFSELKSSAKAILTDLGIDSNEVLYHRMLERLAAASGADVKLMLSFVKKYKQKFDGI